MVRSLLSGEKTQTRRVIPRAELQGWGRDADMIDSLAKSCRYGAPGDRLWVRETWCPAVGADARIVEGKFYYAADGGQLFLSDGDGGTAWTSSGRARSPWRPSIHMPRRASRLVLELTLVRVERLQSITEKDALAEGVGPLSYGGAEDIWMAGDFGLQRGDTRDPRVAFEWLWESVNGERPGCSWDDNPWVWALSFRRLLQEVPR